MIELTYITNERTGERRLYYRYDIFGIDASGALCPTSEKSEWIRVPEKTLEEAFMDDLIESGGIQE